MLDRALVRITTAANYWRLWLALAALLAVLGGRAGPPRRRAVACSRWCSRRQRERSRQAARAPAPSRRAHAARADPRAALDILSLRAQRRRVRIRDGRLRRAARARAAARARSRLAVGYSRVHTGVHYPSDVAAGAAIGVGSAALVEAAAGEPTLERVDPA